MIADVAIEYRSSTRTANADVWPTELIGPAFFYVDDDDIVYILSTMAA
jgi:hypothetical protein